MIDHQLDANFPDLDNFHECETPESTQGLKAVGQMLEVDYAAVAYTSDNEQKYLIFELFISNDTTV